MKPDEIKKIRLALGMTQRDLEQALGMTGPDGRTVRRWENGTKPITGPAKRLLKLYETHGLGILQERESNER